MGKILTHLNLCWQEHLGLNPPKDRKPMKHPFATASKHVGMMSLRLWLQDRTRTVSNQTRSTCLLLEAPWCWQGLLWIDPAWKRSKWIQNWKCIQNWTCFNFLQGQFWIRVDLFWTSSRMVQSKQKGQSSPIYQSDPFGISLKIRTSPVQIVIVKKSIVFLIKPLLVLISLVVWHRASLYWSNGIKTRSFNALIINLSFCCKGILWIKGKIGLLVQKPMWKMICKLQSFLGIYLTQGSP